jgi:hypothetical protein
MIDLHDEIGELIVAGFSGMWIQTYDVYEAATEVINLVLEQSQDGSPPWVLACWDCNEGYAHWNYRNRKWDRPQRETRDARTNQTRQVDVVISDLPDAIEAFLQLADERGKDSEIPAIFLIKNPHLTSPQTTARTVQVLETEAVRGRAERRHVICVSTRGDIPKEIEKQYMSVEHPLPSREKLLDVLSAIELEPDQVPTEEEMPSLVNACMGLTNVEASNAAALSVVRRDKIVPKEIWSVKAQILRKAKGLSLWRGNDKFADIGGMNNVKDFCLRSIQNSQPDNPLMQAKGVMLLGVPGAGKSKFCKALGHETKRPTIRLDVGALMGQYVGNTESNTRECLQVVDASAPCILMVDEIEKALAAGEHAHEVSTRMIGSVLQWLQDHETDVFVICTCNDIHKLIGPHPEFARAGRFDGIFFVDLPTKEEKEVIWQIHLGRYTELGVDPGQDRPDDENWTGAEIECCVKLAALHKIPLVESAINIVPVSEVSETVQSLREWATNKALSALHPGHYKGPEHLEETAHGMSFLTNGGQRKLHRQSVKRKKKRRRPNPEDN